MGAGGGICAIAREELLRPGFKGGAGGKPLDCTTGFAATAAIDAEAIGVAFSVCLTA